MEKVVSVIIPCFNGGDTISTAIKSIDEQTYGNINIIVVDDYSSVEPILDDLAGLTKHQLRLIRNNQNIGANLSIDQGFKLAPDGYVCVLDADDKLPVDSIKVRVEALNSGHDLVFGATEQIYKNRCRVIQNIKTDTNSVLDWLTDKPSHMGINITTAMYTKSLHKRTGHRLERGARGSHEDYEFALRLLLNADNPTTVEDVCYAYNLDDNGSMNQEIKKNKVLWDVALSNLEKEYFNKFSEKLSCIDGKM